ncbi:jg2874 [Pararge aegeria aegeria]|uniref:Jg2874 protein n=1 Tax=Pararge aegeria aegeria TaxID=348720 RepID=A0A8S4SEM8_9NEOP|nr:jg2874 [Pararge aegeria aegeria]
MSSSLGLNLWQCFKLAQNPGDVVKPIISKRMIEEKKENQQLPELMKPQDAKRFQNRRSENVGNLGANNAADMWSKHSTFVFSVLKCCFDCVAILLQFSLKYHLFQQ